MALIYKFRQSSIKIYQNLIDPAATENHNENHMSKNSKVGIIICDRYRRCAGGKCFSSMKNREGAFSRYAGQEVELVGFTICDGCPGGNIEYTGDEMVKNGAEVIHLATELVVGYPPCPYIDTFNNIFETRYEVEVVIGTHPIPQKYLNAHTSLDTWHDPAWESLINPTISEEATRIAYNLATINHDEQISG